MIKLLHTADQQLGVKFLGFGEKGRLLRQAVKESLKKTVDLALAESVELVLIAVIRNPRAACLTLPGAQNEEVHVICSFRACLKF